MVSPSTLQTFPQGFFSVGFFKTLAMKGRKEYPKGIGKELC